MFTSPLYFRFTSILFHSLNMQDNFPLFPALICHWLKNRKTPITSIFQFEFIHSLSVHILHGWLNCSYTKSITMSTHRGMPVKRDANIQDVENDEFPILCETCLGNNPYVRMIRVPYGKGCKSCGRPFTNFRWKAGTDARYKSTQVCQMCAKTKNVCQCCVLDLTYGLPTQVRDTFLARQQVLTMPIEKANRAVYMQEMEKKVALLGEFDR